MSGDFYFLVRDGSVWACWLSGKPAVKLGSVESVHPAVRQLVGDLARAKETAALTRDPIPPAPAPVPPPLKIPPPKRRKEVTERIEPRHETTIFGRIFTVGGSREVTVHDLSERGCRFSDATATLKHGARFTIKLGPVGPIEAEVKWREGSAVGAAFATPLYPSVMAHIRESFSLLS